MKVGFFPPRFLTIICVVWAGLFYCHTTASPGICRHLRFTEAIDGYALQGHVIKNITLRDKIHMHSHCKNRCTMEISCLSINIGLLKDSALCQLSDSDHMQQPGDLAPLKGFAYIGTENMCQTNPCHGGGTCQRGLTGEGYTCLCQAGFTGERCEHGFIAVFTNLGRTGKTGPKSLGDHYADQNHDGQVSLSGGIQHWTVPYTGDYRIEAIGAAGGYSTGDGGKPQYQGRGARMVGTFTLFKGEIIQVLVGQEGWKYRYVSGGSGGSFVVRGTNISLVIAGGGGGGLNLQFRHPGCDASTNKSGNPGYRSWSGGSNGHGAQTADNGKSGGGGGGFYSDGRSGIEYGGVIGSGSEGGKAFLNGGVGGRASILKMQGGFGGGGAGTAYKGGAGGGGGYSGGSSGNGEDDSCGGGGGSFNAGTDQQNECCYNKDGHGRVTITLVKGN